jgi:MSHA biogenesis protein MshQ
VFVAQYVEKKKPLFRSFFPGCSVRRVAARVAVSVLLVGLAASAGAQGWYSKDWQFRQKITIASSLADSDLSDFPLLVRITAAGNAVFAAAQSSGDDLVFTASDGTTLLPHEVEYFNASAGSERLDAWVKVPFFNDTATTEIYLYYGNPSAASQEDPQEVWNAGFRGVWHLNEGVTDEQSTGRHYDSTANGYDGNQNGNAYEPPTGTTRIGGAQRFDGVDDLINIDNVLSDDWTGLTESAWVQVVDYAGSNDPRIICRADSGTPATHIFSLTLDDIDVDTASIRVRLNTDIGGVPQTYIEFGGATVLGENTWYHLAFTWDSATGAARVYLNAAIDASGTKAGDDLRDALVVDDVILGNVSLDDSRWLNGYLDEVRLSNVARSQDWIEAEYRNQNTPGAYLSFQEEVLVQGTAYADAGTIPLGPGRTVSLSVGGGTTSGTDLFSAQTDGEGSF